MNDPTVNPDDGMQALVQGVAARNKVSPATYGVGALNGYRNTVEHVPGGYASASAATRAATAYEQALPGRAILHGQIARLLVAPEQAHVTHRETSGRLDRRALARLGTGAMDVFSRRVDVPGQETALLVLIDLSSSMNMPTGPSSKGPTRHALALTTAYHLALAAEHAGAKVAVYGFGTSRVDNVASAALHPLIPFGMGVRANAHRLASVRATAYTPLSPAILGGAEILRDMPAQRHVQMVVTDGDCDHGAACVTQACNIASAWGVETVGIGMDCDKVIDAFPPGYSVNVTDLDTLGRTGLGVLARMLEDALPEMA